MLREYIGSHHLDAEIHIDFSDRNITMDYSKNEDNDSFSLGSNNGVVYDNKWLLIPYKERLIQATKFVMVMLFISPVIFPFYVLFGTLFLNSRFGSHPQLHYLDQRIKKWVYLNMTGLYEVIRKVDDSRIVIPVPNNLWIEYEISDAAAEKITGVHLMRRFLNYYRYGMSHEIRQDGWEMIFEFSEVPPDSYVSVKYIG